MLRPMSEELGCALPLGFLLFCVGLFAWTSTHEVIYAVGGLIAMFSCLGLKSIRKRE